MAKRICIVKVSDGLGNQLFQYALAKRLNEQGFKVIIDISWYENIEYRFTTRKFQLDSFNSSIEIANQRQCSQIKSPKFIVFFNSFFWKIQSLVPYFRKRHVKEQFSGYDSNIFKIPNKAYLEGFWQSPKYFQNIRNILLKEITLKSESIDIKSYKSEIQLQRTSIAVHIRRGDYTLPNSVHRLLDGTYYSNAIKRMIEILGDNIHFYFFSDEHEFIIQQDYYLVVPYKRVVKTTSAEEDLMLIKTCKHQIISNSTFSWWGAWLNENPNKVVISPTRWFNEEKNENPDLIPDEWIKI
jgi:hypothetical protein